VADRASKSLYLPARNDISMELASESGTRGLLKLLSMSRSAARGPMLRAQANDLDMPSQYGVIIG
jgi:hypothetical protein